VVQSDNVTEPDLHPARRVVRVADPVAGTGAPAAATGSGHVARLRAGRARARTICGCGKYRAALARAGRQSAAASGPRSPGVGAVNTPTFFPTYASSAPD
jgi:hypothetical protein